MYTPQEIAAAIEGIVKANSTTVSAVLKACGLPSTTVANMKSGSMPSADKLASIAAELNTTTDYLLGRTDNPAPSSADALQLSDIEFALLGAVRELDDEDKEDILRNAQKAAELHELRKQQRGKSE